MTSFLGYKRDGEEAVSRVPLAARRMFDGASCATEYGRRRRKRQPLVC